jgi:hypothetical protein
MKGPESPGATPLLDGLDVIVDPSVWHGATFMSDLEFF